MSTSNLADIRPAADRRSLRGVLTNRKALLLLLAVLLCIEQAVFFLGPGQSEQHSTGRPAAPAHLTLAGQVARITAQALGPSDRGVRRYHIDGIAADARHPGLHVVTITWAVNGDLSLGSVSAGAQLDAYLTLRAFYTAHLPISMVYMNGTFADHGPHGRPVEVPVLKIGLERATAALLDWQNLDANTLWPLLHRYMIRPGFECDCQE